MNSIQAAYHELPLCRFAIVDIWLGAWASEVGHLGKEVPASVRQMHSVEQMPFFDTAAEDFPVALLNSGKGLPAGGWDAAKPVVDEFIRQVINVVATGDRTVAIGGTVSGSTIITGNHSNGKGIDVSAE